MKPPEGNDPLDALLRENEAYVEDSGFTARVVALLPPRRRSWLRPAILFSATLLGLALMVWWLPSLKDEVVVGANDGLVMNFNLQSLLTLGVLLAAAAALGWGLIAVVRSED